MNILRKRSSPRFDLQDSEVVGWFLGRTCGLMMWWGSFPSPKKGSWIMWIFFANLGAKNAKTVVVFGFLGLVFWKFAFDWYSTCPPTTQLHTWRFRVIFFSHTSPGGFVAQGGITRGSKYPKCPARVDWPEWTSWVSPLGTMINQYKWVAASTFQCYFVRYEVIKIHYDFHQTLHTFSNLCPKQICHWWLLRD